MLQAVACAVLSLVCGACTCERNWSDFAFIHLKKRNKLSPSKAADLVFVFSNLRLLRGVTANGAREKFHAWVDKDAASSGKRADGEGCVMVEQVQAMAAAGLCDTSEDEGHSSEEEEEEEGDDEAAMEE